MLFILLMFVILSSCKDEKDNPVPFNNVIIDSCSIIKAFYPSGQEIVAPYHIPSIILNYKIDTAMYNVFDGEKRRVKIVIDTLITDDKLDYTYYVNSDSIAIYNQKPYTISGLSNDIEMVTIKYVFRWLIFDKNIWNWVDAVDKDGNPKVERGTLSYKIDKSKIGERDDFQLVNNEEEFEPYLGIVLTANYQFDTAIQVSPYYKTKKENCGLYLYDEDGNSVAFTAKTLGNKILLSPNDKLKSDAKYNIKCSYCWMFYNGEKWISDNNIQTNTFSIVTKKLINEFNTYYQYAYPCINQYHFLKNEYEQGYIKLNIIPEQMDNVSITDKIIIRLTDIVSGDSVEADANWDTGKQFLSYNIPSEFIGNEKIYRFEVIIKNIENSQIVQELTYHFRTSRFNSFSEKFNTYKQGSYWTWPIGWAHEWGSIFYMEEYFDSYEIKLDTINGIEFSSGLIQLKFDFAKGNYFKKGLVNLYETIAKNPEHLKWRTIQLFGIPPTNNSIFLHQSKNTKFLLTSDIENGAAPIGDLTCYFLSRLEVVIDNDSNNYAEYAQLGLADLQLFGASERCYFKIKYTLPGLNIVTSEMESFFYNK